MPLDERWYRLKCEIHTHHGARSLSWRVTRPARPWRRWLGGGVLCCWLTLGGPSCYLVATQEKVRSRSSMWGRAHLPPLQWTRPLSPLRASKLNTDHQHTRRQSIWPRRSRGSDGRTTEVRERRGHARRRTPAMRDNLRAARDARRPATTAGVVGRAAT